MRVVFVNPVSVFGGAERNLLSWIVAFRIACPEARPILVLPSAGPLADRAEAAGVSVERLPMPAALARLGDSRLRGVPTVERLAATISGVISAIPGVWSYIGELRLLLNRLSPDLIHSNGIKSHLALWLSRSTSRREHAAPVVWHIQDYLGHRPLVARLAATASADASLGIAPSESVAADARDIPLQMPVHMVHNVVDPQEFLPQTTSGDLLDRLAGMGPAPSDVVRVVLVATYARWKGHDLFLQAAALARRMTGPPLRFYIVGGPIYATTGSQYSRKELRSLAHASSLTDVLGFIDFQSHPAAIYCAADIVVHASTRPEPFGLTIVEAMACGRAVIAAKAGGASELFTNGVDAVGTVPGNPMLLAEAICTLAEAANLRQSLGRNARTTAMERFSTTNLPTHVMRCYRLALVNSPAPSV